MSQRVRTLLGWCELHGVTLSDIEIVDYGSDHLSFDQSGICVIASCDLSYSDTGLSWAIAFRLTLNLFSDKLTKIEF